jgi:histidine triad (HIT) family protein
VSPSDCLFCRIAAGEIPATTVHEDERTIAFMDINPVTRGHLLVIPRAHSADLTEIAAEDLAATLETAQALAVKAMHGLGAEGVNVVNNCGAAAGQTVFHFHVHVVPRYSGDGFHVPLGGPPGDQDEIAAVAEALRGA